MVAMKTFEDIEAWQQARELARVVYELSTRGAFAKDYRLRDQIRGSAIGVMSNIAEAWAARADAESVSFLGCARRSATALQSHLYVALDQEYVTQWEFDQTYAHVAKTKGLIREFAHSLEKRHQV